MAEEEVREACLQLLSVRPRSRAELSQRLRRKGYETVQIEPVLDRLVQVELVDDVAFAQAWVQSRHMHSGRGRRALAAELRLKGVAEPAASAALAQVDDASEEERARELVRKRLRSMVTAVPGPDVPATVRKLLAMLARRGYPQEMALRVVREELAVRGADGEESVFTGP